MAQMKEQIKALEKIKLSHEEIANLSDAEFKTLIIRVLTEMIEYGCKIKEEVKAIQSEIKKNIQGTDSEGKETTSTIWTRRTKHSTLTARRKRIQKMRRGLGTSGTTLNIPTCESQGCQKRKSKKWKTYLKK